MKKTLKAIFCITLCAVMLLSMASCGAVKKEDVVGKWVFSGTLDGVYYLHILELESNGNFGYMVMNATGNITVDCQGTWKIDGNEIQCYSTEHCNNYSYGSGKHWHNFTYKDGALSNGTISLEKDKD